MSPNLEKPVPVLSKPNVERLVDLVHKTKPQLVVEYGSGSSTLFFIKVLNDIGGARFVSEENVSNWFDFIGGFITKSFGGQLSRFIWKSTKYREFYKGGETPYTAIIDGGSRYSRWKEIVMAGPFWRLVSESGSRLSLNRHAANLIMLILNVLTFLIRIVGFFRHHDSILEADCKNVKLTYILLSPGMKDQFGESPFRAEYANAWKPYYTTHNLYYL